LYSDKVFNVLAYGHGQCFIRIVVLCVGTNNHENTADEICDALATIVKEIHARQPEAHVLVVEIPPRGQQPNVVRDKLQAVNRLMRDRKIGQDFYRTDDRRLEKRRDHSTHREGPDPCA
jgi:hypothetical protein